MLLFAIATISPFALIGVAAVVGGVWGWLALGYVTVLVFVLDRLIAGQIRNADPEAEFPAADTLLVALGLGHFWLMAVAILAVSGTTGLGAPDRAVIAISAALVFGQISHPVAHELIHRPARRLRLLGKLVYSSILFGHHASAHLRVHHVHVGSSDDPNSARRGEGFYRFMLRAWRGSFRAGLAAENRLRQSGERPIWSHPYALYLAGALAMLALAGLLGGPAGAGALIFMSAYAQAQILLSDYVQHYGLRRAVRADGTRAPVGPQHSWNAPHWYSSAMMLNAPRHSDHHVTPSRPYPALQLASGQMPTLPHSLPVMAVLALAPPLWRRIMDPLCTRWDAPEQDGLRSPLPASGQDAKAGGLAGQDLPHSGHEDDPDRDMPDGHHAGPCPGADERGGV